LREVSESFIAARASNLMECVNIVLADQTRPDQTERTSGPTTLPQHTKLHPHWSAFIII